MKPKTQCLDSLWEYLGVRHEPEQADAAFVFGRDDFNIPRKALELYTGGLVSVLFLLGGRGRLTGTLEVPESEAFRSFLAERGVDEDAMITEDVSTNTGENLDQGLKMLTRSGIGTQRILLITHVPHARRVLAGARIRCSSIEFLSCPDDCILPPADSPDIKAAASEAAGEIRRLIEYGKRGYIREQNIPPEILRCTSVLEELY